MSRYVQPCPTPAPASPRPCSAPPLPRTIRFALYTHSTLPTSIPWPSVVSCRPLWGSAGCHIVRRGGIGRVGARGGRLALTWPLHALHPASGISTGRLGGRAAGAEVSSGGRGGVGRGRAGSGGVGWRSGGEGSGWGSVAFYALGGTRICGARQCRNVPRPVPLNHTCTRAQPHLQQHLLAGSPDPGHTCPVPGQICRRPRLSATTPYPPSRNLPRRHTSHTYQTFPAVTASPHSDKLRHRLSLQISPHRHTFSLPLVTLTPVQASLKVTRGGAGGSAAGGGQAGKKLKDSAAGAHKTNSGKLRPRKEGRHGWESLWSLLSLSPPSLPQTLDFPPMPPARDPFPRPVPTVLLSYTLKVASPALPQSHPCPHRASPALPRPAPPKPRLNTFSGHGVGQPRKEGGGGTQGGRGGGGNLREGQKDVGREDVRGKEGVRGVRGAGKRHSIFMRLTGVFGSEEAGKRTSCGAFTVDRGTQESPGRAGRDGYADHRPLLRDEEAAGLICAPSWLQVLRKPSVLISKLPGRYSGSSQHRRPRRHCRRSVARGGLRAARDLSILTGFPLPLPRRRRSHSPRCHSHNALPSHQLMAPLANFSSHCRRWGRCHLAPIPGERRNFASVRRRRSGHVYPHPRPQSD
ncbi:hypothetical protein O3P69_018534 [Scylla paramamosain]|uniref:Uncharacterized protein n=1 Tax=Scylla paramamosain TaxID=85552 RepID=A0AAW0T3G9_SCYPA